MSRNLTVTAPEPPGRAVPAGQGEPSGGNGASGGAVCKCGAGPHADDPERCASNHFLPGNSKALVTAEHSGKFWHEADGVRRELRSAIIADQGHTESDAPRALSIAAESIAQAVLVRDSAFRRMAESGGPLSSGGRARRCLDVWLGAMDRVERHLKVVGLKRVPRPAPSSFADAIAAAPVLGGADDER